MTKQHFIRIGIYVGGILLIILVLTISVTRQALYTPSPGETQAKGRMPVSARIEELREWPPLPDNPLYVFRVVGDRVRLLLASQDDKPVVEIELATDRLVSAQKLLAHKRTTLALTTLTKSTKYVLSAVSNAGKASPNRSTISRAKVRSAIATQIEQLNLMKRSFSDEQKSIIDRLLSELEIAYTQFL